MIFNTLEQMSLKEHLFSTKKCRQLIPMLLNTLNKFLYIFFNCLIEADLSNKVSWIEDSWR